jgi:hypothetical protein
MTSRRTVLAAAWSAPIILAATSAPAAAASATPPATPACLPLTFTPLPGEPEFKDNQGNGFTLITGTGVTVTNTTTSQLTVPVTLWTSAHQEGVRLTTSTGDVLLTAPKDGNQATVTISIGPGQSRQLRIVVDHSNAEAHLVVSCDGFLFKSVGAE